jgi:hypothetical protein
MKRFLVLLPVSALAALMFTGCAQPAYYPPPPPPPVAVAPPPIVQMADANGFHAGMEDGLRDLNRGFGYRPQGDRRFHDAPGWDPNFGPRRVYVDNFRRAYLRGYDKAFYRR